MAGASCSSRETYRQTTGKAKRSWAVRDSESGHGKPTAAGPLSWFGTMTGLSSLCSRKLEWYPGFYGGAEPALLPLVSTVPHSRPMLTPHTLMHTRLPPRTLTHTPGPMHSRAPAPKPYHTQSRTPAPYTLICTQSQTFCTCIQTH